MPGPDFTEETAALNDAEATLQQARTEFTENIAAQCEPNITAWAKAAFLSHPDAADKLSDAFLRTLRDRINYMAHEIAEAIRELARTPDWPAPTVLSPAMPAALRAVHAPADYRVEQSLTEHVSQYVDRINKDIHEAGLFAPNPSSTSPQPFGEPVIAASSTVELAGRTIWGPIDDKSLIAAAHAVTTKQQDLKDAEAAYRQQTLNQRWDDAMPGNDPA